MKNIKKNIKNRKAFSMIELIFVIVILGILAGVAVPKMMGTRTDAYISKAKSQIASIKNGINTSAATSMLSGGCSNRYPVDLNQTDTDTGFKTNYVNKGVELFNGVLKEGIISSSGDGGWMATGVYRNAENDFSPETFRFTIESGRTVIFTYDETQGLFTCGSETRTGDCLTLTK